MQHAPNGWQLPAESERSVKLGLKHTFLVIGIALQDSGGYKGFQSASFLLWKLAAIPKYQNYFWQAKTEIYSLGWFLSRTSSGVMHFVHFTGFLALFSLLWISLETLASGCTLTLSTGMSHQLWCSLENGHPASIKITFLEQWWQILFALYLKKVSVGTQPNFTDVNYISRSSVKQISQEPMYIFTLNSLFLLTM